MWIAKFIFCTMLDGCSAVTFDDQLDFAAKTECEAYTEQKALLVAEKMNEYNVFGKMYYGCDYKEIGLKT